MAEFGYTLSSEEFGPQELVRLAVRAEEAGMDFCSISDHFHPWVSEQGHSPFVWTVLGALSQATSEIGVAVGVTCPTVRIHPVILAQAAATTSLMLGGRFVWGLGSGEALNEHVAGHRWPPADTRLLMLEEAVDIIRQLWSGESIDHHGRFYDVENARIYDAPDPAPPIVMSGFGPASVKLAARIGDGYWGTSPDPDPLDRYRETGGLGPRYGQMTVCVGPDVEQCRATVHRVWPNGAITGQLSQDLPTSTHFEQAAKLVSQEDAVSSVPCGPDARAVVEAAREYLDAGYDRIYFHQVGPDQEAFFRMWSEELQPELG